MEGETRGRVGESGGQESLQEMAQMGFDLEGPMGQLLQPQTIQALQQAEMPQARAADMTHVVC